MKIVSIGLKNFKCFSNETIKNLNKVNVFIGENNSGKSSIISALDIAFNQKNRQIDLHNTIYKDFDFKNPPELALTIDLQEDNILPKEFEPISKKLRNKKVKVVIDLSKAYVKNNIDDNKFVKEIKFEEALDISDTLRTMIREGVVQFIRNTSLIAIPSNRTIKPESKGLAVSPNEISDNGTGLSSYIWNQLSVSGNDPRIIHRLKSEISLVYPEFSKYSFIQKETQNGQTFFLGKDENEFPLENLGTGIGQLILIAAIMRFKSTNKNLIICLDEPENSLHPKLQKNLIKYILNKAGQQNIQFYITTHSPFFIEPESMNVFQVKEGTIKLVDSEKLRDVYYDIGISPSDILQSSGILFVEGISDKFIIKKWLDDWLDRNDKKEMKNLVIYPLYGDGGIKYFDPKEIANLNNFFSVIDSEKINESQEINEERKIFHSRCLENGGLSFITEKRAIENYLPSKKLTEYFSSKYNLPIEEVEIGDFGNLKEKIQQISKKMNVQMAYTKVHDLRKISQLLDYDDIPAEFLHYFKEINSKLSH